jgi:hypothetical protein
MSAELNARFTAATAVAADFQTDLTEVRPRGTYWDRLCWHLESVLEQIGCAPLPRVRRLTCVAAPWKTAQPRVETPWGAARCT